MESIWLILSFLSVIISTCYSAKYFMTDVYTLKSATPSKSNVVTTIDVLDRMTIIMDITINSFDKGYQNIMNTNVERYPGIWMLDNMLLIVFSDHWDQCKVQLKRKYNLKIEITQSEYRVFIANQIDDLNYQDLCQKIDNQIFYEAHETPKSQFLYIGDPWYDPADVLIEDLQIQKVADLCVAYAEDTVPEKGSTFSYRGELNDKPYWQRGTDDRYIYRIHPNQRGYTWVCSDMIFDHWTEIDSPLNGAVNWVRYPDDVEGEDPNYNDEVDSAFGAEWNSPIFMSAKVCGMTADQTEQEFN